MSPLSFPNRTNHERTVAQHQPESVPQLPPKSHRPLRTSCLFPGPWCRAIVALALIALLLFHNRVLGAGLEQANLNVIMFVLGLVAMTTLVVWFLGCSAGSPELRCGVAGVLIFWLAAAITCVRIEQVSGDLVPKLAFRWQPHADQRLAKPVAGTAACSICKRPRPMISPSFSARAATRV